MPMTATAPPTDQTWMDWAPAMPEPDASDLLTRRDFLAALRARNVHVAERTLIYWEKRGALPRPIPQRLGRAAQAAYPAWAVPIAASVPGLQAEGLSLPEIGEKLRQLAQTAHVTAADAGTITATETGSIYKRPSDDAFDTQLAAIARRFQQLSDRP